MNPINKYAIFCKLVIYLYNNGGLTEKDEKEITRITYSDLIISIIGFPFFVLIFIVANIADIIIKISYHLAKSLDKEIKFKR